MSNKLSVTKPEEYALMQKVFPEAAKMMEHFSQYSHIDDALGLKGAACHWAAGRNGVSAASKRLAQIWVEKNITQTQPAPADHDGVFLIAVPPAKIDKVRRVLEMMGCEVIE